MTEPVPHHHRSPTTTNTLGTNHLDGPVGRRTYVRYSSDVEKPAPALSALQSGGHVKKLTLAQDQVLPIRSDLLPLFPWGGIKRGTVVETSSSALMLALLGKATSEGSWVAVVGSPDLGLAAAREHGVALERLVVVHRPPQDQMATVISALVDALDIVVIGSRLITSGVDARRLSARARERGSVLLSRGGWLVGPDLSLHVRSQHFLGLSEGHGHLAGWSIEVETSGRGAASLSRRVHLGLAGNHEAATGSAAPVTPRHAGPLGVPLGRVS